MQNNPVSSLHNSSLLSKVSPVFTLRYVATEDRLPNNRAKISDDWKRFAFKKQNNCEWNINTATVLVVICLNKAEIMIVHNWKRG